MNPDHHSDEDERHGRHGHRSVVQISHFVNTLWQDFKSEQRSSAEQLSHRSHHHEDDAVAESVGETVDKRRPRLVLHGESLQTTHKDTVGDDETNVDREFHADVIDVCLEHLAHDGNEGCHHNELHHDTDARWHGVADERDDEVAECRGYGVINEYPFFCTCGMGFDAFVSMKFAESGKRGPISYAENILREGLKYQPETYTLEDETGTKQYKAFLISCANASQYGNNAYIAPQASMSDGLMDVIIMEPFDVLEAPQVSFDMFNKTLDKNSKIKSFRCKKLHITRSQPGVIHYDGDPVMSGTEIDVHLEEKGIKMIVNPYADKNARKPNAIQTAFTEFFNDLNAMRDDFNKQSKKVEALSKLVQRKLNI